MNPANIIAISKTVKPGKMKLTNRSSIRGENKGSMKQ